MLAFDRVRLLARVCLELDPLTVRGALFPDADDDSWRQLAQSFPFAEATAQVEAPASDFIARPIADATIRSAMRSAPTLTTRTLVSVNASPVYRRRLAIRQNRQAVVCVITSGPLAVRVASCSR